MEVVRKVLLTGAWGSLDVAAKKGHCLVGYRSLVAFVIGWP